MYNSGTYTRWRILDWRKQTKTYFYDACFFACRRVTYSALSRAMTTDIAHSTMDNDSSAPGEIRMTTHSHGQQNKALVKAIA